MILFRLLTRKWIASTLLVLIGMAVMIRLGIWQLDRLEQRRIFNARVYQQINKSPLWLTSATINQELMIMEYRTVIVRGEYDFSNQVALRNQAWNNQYGIHLITPLLISGTDRVILVDRGWIPAEDIEPENWHKYDEPGEIEVTGTIRRSQEKPDFGRISNPIQDSGERLSAWNLIDLEQMKVQMPFDILTVYVTQAPNDTHLGLPYRSEFNLDLSEGPHLGYAIQWFTFATIFALIYGFYVNRAEKKNSIVNLNKPRTRIESQSLGDQNAQ